MSWSHLSGVASRHFWVNASGRCDKVLSGFVSVGKCKIACSHVQAFVGTIQKLHREPKVPFHGLSEAFRPVHFCHRLQTHVIRLEDGRH